jgi:hypothetical protein
VIERNSNETLELILEMNKLQKDNMDKKYKIDEG